MNESSLSFEQVLAIVKQLPNIEKIRLSQELEKDTRSRVLTQLLEAFETDELDQATIDAEVETVRAEIYARKSGSQGRH